MEERKLAQHQLRVLNERRDVQIRFMFWEWRLAGPTVDEIDPQERALLSAQHSIINAYLQILQFQMMRGRFHTNEPALVH
jgi:hypothetical protein